MASKIRGITIEIGADTNDLMKAFKSVDSSLKDTDKALKDVNKLLKFDSGNVTLLGQKQEYLKEAIDKAKESLKVQQEMLDKMPTDSTGKLSEEQLALQRNIEETKQKLAGYSTQLKDTEQKLSGAETVTESLKNETKEAGKQFDDSGKKASTFGQMLKANLSASAIQNFGKAIVDVGKKVFELGKNTAAYADDVLTLSTQFGMSTEKIQEFKYMSELTDTSLETITGSMMKMTKNMQTATKGTGDAASAFQTLGINVKGSDGQLRDTNEVFNEVIGALSGMDNETQKNALAMQIFGKSASQLNPLIAVGAEGLANYAQEAHDMGYVLSEETLGTLGSVDDSLQRANKAMEAVTNQVGAYLAPVVAEITEAFANWAKSVDWKTVGTIISEVMSVIGKAMGWVLDIIAKLIVKIRDWAVTVDWTKVGNTIKSAFNTIGKAVQGGIDIFKSIINTIGKVGQAIKDIFTGKFKWPKIPMPHFGITPKGWKIGDLLKGQIPRLAIDWYAKGYQGMVLDGATIFGMNKNGQLMAGGEKGREIIIGEKNLMNMIRSASGTPQVNVVINQATNPVATARYVANELQYALMSERSVFG